MTQIRNMTEKDFATVVRLYADANPFSTRADILDWTQQWFQKFPEFNFVATENSNIIGAISGFAIGKVGWVNDIAVRRDDRQRRIGTQLLKKLLTTWTVRRMTTAKLLVFWTNAGAIPFYYRNGFVLDRVGKTKNIPGCPDGIDILFMKKSL